jgi:hypothetical protein
VQRFVDLNLAPSFDAAQGFVLRYDTQINAIYANLTFSFRGPWDSDTVKQFRKASLSLLISNGTHRYAPLLQLTAYEDTLPQIVMGRGELCTIAFSVQNISLAMYSQNVYYLHPKVPVPRNFDPIHSTETRVFWTQGNVTAIDGLSLPFYVFRDTGDLLGLGATDWTHMTTEIAGVLGIDSTDIRHTLSVNAILERIPEPLPVPIASITPISSHEQKSKSLTYFGYIITGILVIAVSICSFSLVRWMRDRMGAEENLFTRIFDKLTPWIDHDQSSYSANEISDAQSQKDRMELERVLNAHENQAEVIPLGKYYDSDFD